MAAAAAAALHLGRCTAVAALLLRVRGFLLVPRLVVRRGAFLLTFTVICFILCRTTRDISTDCSASMLLLKLTKSDSTSAWQLTYAHRSTFRIGGCALLIALTKPARSVLLMGCTLAGMSSVVLVPFVASCRAAEEQNSQQVTEGSSKIKGAVAATLAEYSA
jgi:hypothetical protein